MSTQPPAPPRLFARLEAPLAPLDRMERRLWLGALTNSQGRIGARLLALECWRAALIDGVLPAIDTLDWPPGRIARPLAAAMDALALPAYCDERPELADTVLQSVLFHLDLIVDYVDRGAAEDESVAMAIEAFTADWRERCGAIDEIIEVVGDLGDLLKNTRWDVIRGLLESGDWQELVRIRRLLGELPALANLIRGLGRNHSTEQDDPVGQSSVSLVQEATAQEGYARTVRQPDLPGETRGTHRSGRVARMLPSEAMLLLHPRLRLVWHARHAERTLLAYEDDDRYEERRHRARSQLHPSPVRRPEKRLEMGPMLICVDTSGSMRGGAEAVAKAVVLEAARAAHAQGRGCQVFAFGGPDELVEMELALDAQGVGRLARFLGQAFRGGTDICGPLQRALDKLEEARWRRADLLIASDGEFGATPALAERVRAARSDVGMRVQGVLIGDRETIGFLELADDIFWVRDWRRFGGVATDSPVHSKSLTANYFPGALRSAENLDATVSGAAASAAVRAGARGPAGQAPD